MTRPVGWGDPGDGGRHWSSKRRHGGHEVSPYQVPLLQTPGPSLRDSRSASSQISPLDNFSSPRFQTLLKSNYTPLPSLELSLCL